MEEDLKKKFVDINYLNPRDFTVDNHKTVDDKAYGGGPGMVMMLDPLIKSIESARTREIGRASCRERV